MDVKEILATVELLKVLVAIIFCRSNYSSLRLLRTILLQGRCVLIDRFHSEMIEFDQEENEMRRLLVSTSLQF